MFFTAKLNLWLAHLRRWLQGSNDVFVGMVEKFSLIMVTTFSIIFPKLFKSNLVNVTCSSAHWRLLSQAVTMPPEMKTAIRNIFLIGNHHCHIVWIMRASASKDKSKLFGSMTAMLSSTCPNRPSTYLSKTFNAVASYMICVENSEFSHVRNGGRL